MKIYHHISDVSPFRLTESGQVLEGLDVEFAQTGTPYGRYLFTDWEAIVSNVEGVRDIQIHNNVFRGNGSPDVTVIELTGVRNAWLTNNIFTNVGLAMSL